MDLNEFNNIYLSRLLGIILKENDIVFLLRNFIIYLLKYDDKPNLINEFLDSLSSNTFYQYNKEEISEQT